MNLKQLADSLGLSQTTVSRALNGYPEVSEATRNRVLSAARRHNYHPNTRARRLATGRTMTIGHVVPLDGAMANPIFTDFMGGASEVYSREGYDMLLSNTRPGEEESAYRTLASNGSVDGVIVHGPRAGDTRIALLKELGLPFLVHGRTADPAGYSWLDVANMRAFKRATQHLLDLGHTRIALLNGQPDYDFALRRERGFQEAMAERGLTPNPDWITWDEMTEAYGYEQATRLLNQPTPPTAFLSSSILPAIGIRRAADQRGLKLGRDLSLVTHDDDLSYLRNATDGTGFTATRSSVRDAGQCCAELLIDLIRNPDQGPRQVLWECELTLGNTTGPAPRSD